MSRSEGMIFFFRFLLTGFRDVDDSQSHKILVSKSTILRALVVRSHTRTVHESQEKVNTKKYVVHVCSIQLLLSSS